MPDAPKGFKVHAIRRTPSPDPKRPGKWDKIVIYELDNGTRDAVVIPEETFSDATLIAAVKADLQEKGQWLKKAFQL